VQKAFSHASLTFLLGKAHPFLQGCIKLLDEERLAATWVTPEVDALDVIELFVLLLEKLKRLALRICGAKLLVVIFVSFELVLITEKMVDVLIKPCYDHFLVRVSFYFFCCDHFLVVCL